MDLLLMLLSEKETHTEEVTKTFLGIVENLSNEINGARGIATSVSLDSHLENELGIDSLSRMELLLRIEQQLHGTIPDSIAVSAETPRELLAALNLRERCHRKASDTEKGASILRDIQVPRKASTLLDVLDWHDNRHGDLEHIILYEENSKSSIISFHDLSIQAKQTARALHAHGLEMGDTVSLMFPTEKEFFVNFFGVLLAGGIPVPIYPPVRLSNIEDHLLRQLSILNNAEVKFLLTFEQGKLFSNLLKANLPKLKAVLTSHEIKEAKGGHALVNKITPETIALIQYTSGSTGDPKGVVLTHAQLLANIRAIGQATQATPQDVIVSWLPLYHDMGLIGAWLGSLYYGVTAVLFSPLSFVARPLRWFEAITEYKATISAAPNFAYQICASKLREEDLQNINLETWRVAFNGAEPVSASTLEKFVSRFSKYGFREGALFPVYGLAECAVGLTFPELGKPPIIDSVERSKLLSSGLAEKTSELGDNTARLVSCGKPLNGYELRIVDRFGNELGEREQGEIQFKGPSATSGYYKNPKANKLLFSGEWLNTGDNGYLVDGNLFITGRIKDMIIRAGRNIHPIEIEEKISQISGVRKGCVVAFGISDLTKGIEKLVVAIETNLDTEFERNKLTNSVKDEVSKLLSIQADEILLLPPRSIPKTSSGKIRRSACRDLYKSGLLGKREAVYKQFIRIAVSSILPNFKRLTRVVFEKLFAFYASMIFVFAGILAFVLVIILPTKQSRRIGASFAAKIFFFLSGIYPKTTGYSYLLDTKPQVLVSNHLSYLDSLLLTAVLPPLYAFVAKRELLDNFFLRISLPRLGTLFVHRFDHEQSIQDADSVLQAIKEGESLCFFPEATFVRSSGLLPFKLGAFLAAAKTRAPVVPIVIHGTRSALRPGQWLLRKVALRVDVCKPIASDKDDWESVLMLRDTVREKILERMQA
jgi:1-acyl-sn-glycerol-3-phosphate acyltransferase